jgi:hypothetical protein
VIHTSSRKAPLGVLCLALLLAACGGGSGASSGVISLIGKRIPGTSSSWHPIAVSKSVARAVTPSALTYQGTLNQFVAFFEFSSPSSASTFYNNPQPAAQLLELGPQGFVNLPGSGPVQAPSRWVNRSWCIWTGGPNPRGIPTGAPFGVHPDSRGRCSQGARESLGFASISRRGDVVFIVQTGGNADELSNGSGPVIGSPADSALVTQNIKLAVGTLTLFSSANIG